MKPTYKIVVCGDQSTGKTSIVKRYVEQKEYTSGQPTPTQDECTKEITIGGQPMTLFILDISGAKRFEDSRQKQFKDSDGIILVCDLTNRDSLNNLDSWKQEITNHCVENIPIVVVGSKEDDKQNSIVQEIEIESYVAGKQNMEWTICSAKENRNIDELFTMLSKHFIGKIPNYPDQQSSPKTDNDDKKKRSTGKKSSKSETQPLISGHVDNNDTNSNTNNDKNGGKKKKKRCCTLL